MVEPSAIAVYSSATETSVGALRERYCSYDEGERSSVLDAFVSAWAEKGAEKFVAFGVAKASSAQIDKIVAVIFLIHNYYTTND